MTKFTPQFLDQIRDNVTLSDIIRSSVKLTRAGREFKGCCPFHNEKTPSFYVNDDKQFYHCFGCGAHGDAIRFLVEHDNMSFPEAVEQLAGKAGVPMPIQQQQTAAEFHYEQVRKGLYELMEDASTWFCKQLYASENKAFLDYLTGRGVTNEMLSSFMIGCAPIDGSLLPKYLLSLDYDEEQILESGLCRKSQKDGSLYAFFRERIMFPVLDRKGRTVTFGGRILPDHVRQSAGFPPHSESFTPPKYINGADSPLFNKSHTLYGEYQLRRAAREKHTPIIVEGYLDVIACHAAGFKGAMAPMGTALTPEQITVLWKLGGYIQKTPVLCFDGDNAGLRAAERALERILPGVSADKSASFAFLPKGEDPDSLIKAKGAVALRDILVNALVLVDYLWFSKTQGRDFKTPENRAALERDLYNAVETVQDEKTKSYYKKEIRDRLYKEFSSFKRKDENKAGRSAKYQQQAVINLAGTSDGLLEKLKSLLLLAVIYQPFLLDRFYDSMERQSFVQQDLEALRLHILDYDSEQFQTKDDIEAALRKEGFSDTVDKLDIKSLRLHAVWIENDDDRQAVSKGWDSTLQRINDLSHKQELEAAVRALEADFSEENVARLEALQKASV